MNKTKRFFSTAAPYGYYEELEINQELMDSIASYMNDEIRESLHHEIAPCEPEEFLLKYLEQDSEFSQLLKNEFNIILKII